MGAPESLRQKFSRYDPLLTELKRYVRDTLRPYCEDRKYSFLDRIKSLQSLSEKLEGGRYASWSELNDLYACTVVVPTVAHESGVLTVLRDRFSEQDVVGRSSTRKAPEVFRFDGVRWYGRMHEAAAVARQPGVGDVVFEVQILTAFEHAWTIVSHDLVYKSNSADWRRARLAAQLKAAVEQIELIIAAFEPAASLVTASPWPEVDVQQEIIEMFVHYQLEDRLPVTLVPESWRRFAGNVWALVATYERNRQKLPTAVRKLLDTIRADFDRGYELPLSGSLFQYVLSVVARADGPGNLSNFPVVASSELSDFYGLPDLPKVFDFGTTE
jgi:ppGpp synthetase/RelA/SpoT-type nucleotidyltranferase